MKRIYIAGPMTGLPEFNYPAFNAKAAELRAQGWHVENPAENPVPECGTWLGYMRMALRQLALCDAIYMLPGHERSRGAGIELRLATGMGLEVLHDESAAATDAESINDTDTLASIARWFQQAVPVPSSANKLAQLGCHFEEVAEMLYALGTCRAIDVDDLATALKMAAGDADGADRFMREIEEGIDMPELLDSLCDQIVTAIGVAHMMGFDLQGALAEVNRANWSKFVDGRPLFDINGKIMKGPHYAPPHITPFAYPFQPSEVAA